MHKSEDKTLLFALLPSSIKEEPVFKHSAEALYAGDDSKDHLKDGLFYYRFDELSSDILDHLAAQWHAHVWRDSWNIETKRQVLRSLIQTKSHLGTKGAIKDVLAGIVGSQASSIKEWFEKSKVGASGQRFNNVVLSFTSVIVFMDMSQQGMESVTSSHANSNCSGGVGGSDSGSGRSHAANRAKAASTATHKMPQKRTYLFSFCVLIFFIVMIFKGYDFLLAKLQFYCDV